MAKSQAALEFLSTYGWAFLVILIMIASLSYFGILSPRKYLPDSCVTGSELGCVRYKITKTGIKLGLKNNVGSPIIVNTITASSQNVTCTSPMLNSIYKSGQIKDIFFPCDLSGAGLEIGDKAKLQLNVEYELTSSSSSFVKSVSGEIFSTVQAAFGEQIDPNSQIASALNTAKELSFLVNKYKSDVGFYPFDVSRGNDPGFVKMFPNNPETGEGVAVSVSRCQPANWNETLQQRWSGPYLTAWPNQTPWGGEYDYNLWPDGASRYGLNVPSGIYVGIQRDRQDTPQSQIPPDVESELVVKGIDADGGVNGEVQLLLSNITC